MSIRIKIAMKKYSNQNSYTYFKKDKREIIKLKKKIAVKLDALEYKQLKWQIFRKNEKNKFR